MAVISIRMRVALLLLLLLLPTAVYCATEEPNVAVEPKMRGVHLQLHHSDSSKVIVMWESQELVADPIVHYGLGERRFFLFFLLSRCDA